MIDATSLTAQDLEQWFVTRIADALKIGSEEVDVDAPLSDHGLDSLSALTMTGELEKMLGRRLPATLFWEYPTIARLSKHLAR
jgi:acyl carrier protein